MTAIGVERGSILFLTDDDHKPLQMSHYCQGVIGWDDAAHQLQKDNNDNQNPLQKITTIANPLQKPHTFVFYSCFFTTVVFYLHCFSFAVVFSKRFFFSVRLFFHDFVLFWTFVFLSVCFFSCCGSSKCRSGHLQIWISYLDLLNNDCIWIIFACFLKEWDHCKSLNSYSKNRP